VYQASTGARGRRDAEGIASKAGLDVIEGKYDIKRQKKTPLFKGAMARFLEHVRRTHKADGSGARLDAYPSRQSIRCGNVDTKGRYGVI
jgi:hypothetical protein